MLVDDDVYNNFVQNKNFDVLINGEVPSIGQNFKLPYTIKLTGKGGRTFTKAQSNEFDPIMESYDVFIINPPNVATKTFNRATGEFDYKDWTFETEGGGEVVTPSFDYVVTQKFIDELAAKKVTLYINDTLAVDGGGFNKPYNVRLVVASTHRATEYRDSKWNPLTETYFKLTPSNDFKTLTGVISKSESNIDQFVIETDIDGSVVPPCKVAYNDVFVLTPEQARVIATTQYDFYNLGANTVNPQGNNIISLINLPFNIDRALIQGSKKIKIGKVDVDITAEYLNIDNYVLDLGSITVPDDKQNLLSFKNATAILHLPYANPINIDVDYVIGQTINVTYNVNFYDGVASVNISSSKINGVVDTKSIKLNINIPFGKPDDNPIGSSPHNIEFGIDNGVLRPYIEILRNDVVLENGFFTIPVPDETLLIKQSGFVKIDEIDLKVKASREEKDMILTAINQGLIIK